MTTDEVRAPVVSYPRWAGRYWLTEAELAALDAAELHSRAVAAEARALAEARRTQQLSGTLPISV